MAFLGLFLFVPLAAVFAEALKKGWSAYLASIAEPDALAANSPDSDRRRHSRAAQYAVRGRGGLGDRQVRFSAARNLLTTLIDLPFSVSPVIAG